VCADSLWSIARTYGLTTQSLAHSNGLNANGIVQVGQVLNIPSAARLAATNPAAASPAAAVTYVVKAGDTVSRIARKFSVSIAQILRWNALRSNHVIMPGQRLQLHVRNRGRGGI
jgi:membrane-bound lytic murein transglycosylase D